VGSVSAPLTLPDGSVWQPTPLGLLRILRACQENDLAMMDHRWRPVMARLAQVRRHGKGGGLA
jgi:hypothetical protein